MQNFLRRVIVIPEKLSSALYAALLVFAVQAEVWLAALVNQWLGVQIDFSGAVAVWASILALLLVALVKRFLEWAIPEQWHDVVNSFLVWLAGLLAAHALFSVL